MTLKLGDKGRKIAIMQDFLRAAIVLHQAGQLGQAAEVYQQVLAQILKRRWCCTFLVCSITSKGTIRGPSR